MKTCNSCRQPKSFDSFYRNNANRDKLMGHCKECHKARLNETDEKRTPEKKRLLKDRHNAQRRKRREDPIIRRQYNLATLHRNERNVFRKTATAQNSRAMGRGKLDPKELWSLARRQKLRCPLSGLYLTRKDISLDHIIPLSKGGSNTIENVRFVHRTVNNMKHDHTDAEFLSMCGDITLFTRLE